MKEIHGAKKRQFSYLLRKEKRNSAWKSFGRGHLIATKTYGDIVIRRDLELMINKPNLLKICQRKLATKNGNKTTNCLYFFYGSNYFS